MGGYFNNTGKVFLGMTALTAVGTFLAGRGSKTLTHECQQQRSDEDRSSNRAWSGFIVLLAAGLLVGTVAVIGYASFKLTRYIISRLRARAFLKSNAAQTASASPHTSSMRGLGE